MQCRADVNRAQTFKPRAGTVVKVHGQGHLSLFWRGGTTAPHEEPGNCDGQVFAGGLPLTMHTIAVLQEAARRYHCPVGPIAARFTVPILRGLI
jgi:hypothetical protein